MLLFRLSGRWRDVLPTCDPESPHARGAGCHQLQDIFRMRHLSRFPQHIQPIVCKINLEPKKSYNLETQGIKKRWSFSKEAVFLKHMTPTLSQHFARRGLIGESEKSATTRKTKKKKMEKKKEKNEKREKHKLFFRRFRLFLRCVFFFCFGAFFAFFSIFSCFSRFFWIFRVFRVFHGFRVFSTVFSHCSCFSRCFFAFLACFAMFAFLAVRLFSHFVCFSHFFARFSDFFLLPPLKQRQRTVQLILNSIEYVEIKLNMIS